VWVGGFVAVAVVARAARRELDAAARVAFFRSLARSYGKVGGSALAVAMLTGTTLLAHWRRSLVAQSSGELGGVSAEASTTADRPDDNELGAQPRGRPRRARAVPGSRPAR